MSYFNREIYFDKVRSSLFGGGLDQQQVDGQESILATWEAQVVMVDLRWLAYMLATAFHETAYRMWPITEYGSQSYLQGKPYWPYIGRGLVQLTWEDNYRKATDELGLSGGDDLVKYPDRALDPIIATKIMFLGMEEGWFTSKQLDQYFNDSKDDPVNARQIINGNDDDDLIAGYHRKFLDALKAAEMTTAGPPVAPPVDPPKGELGTNPNTSVQVYLNVPAGQEYDIFVNGLQVVKGAG
jgi:putative chitinase